MLNRQEKWFQRFCKGHCLTRDKAYERVDESEDKNFYSRDRFVSHLDRTALATVEHVIETLIVEKSPLILDLMAGPDSHLPSSLNPAGVVGLGLNENELQQNPALTEHLFHDLNENPRLPFEDNTFDAIINTVSVDYLTRPADVFSEAARVIKPGGLMLVIFSNRYFPEKVVRIWRDSNDDERLWMVRDLFTDSGLFEESKVFVSKGKPRPKDDKYARTGLPSDPVYVVYADKKGPAKTDRPEIYEPVRESCDPSELDSRMKKIKDTCCCPYCGERMLKWEVPDNPFGQTWDNEYMYICFNDNCSYYVRGCDNLMKSVGRHSSYRLMWNPEKDCCLPVPVPSPQALREGIIE